MPHTYKCTGRSCRGVALLLLFSAVPVLAQAQEDVRMVGPDDAIHTLLVRGSTDIDAFVPVMQAFVDTTTNTRIRYEQWGSNALYQKSDDDCQQAGADADLLISSAIDQQVKLVNDGCAMAHRSVNTRRLPDHAIWRDELFGITREPAVLVYNREELVGDEVPLSRFDLIDQLRPNDSRFAGRVATYDIEQSGLGYLFAFADSQQASTFGALLEAFGRTGAVATCCSAELIDAVAEGRFLVAYNVLGSYALARAAIDPRIGVVAPQDYTLTLSRGAMIPRGAQEADIARAFLDFLLSDQGRVVLSQSHLIATFDDSDLADFSSIPGATPVLRPIPLSPTLLVGLDQMKRALFIRQWREKMVLQPGRVESLNHLSAAFSAASASSKVEILRSGNAWTLQVDGQPFVVHGAGMGFSDEAGVARLAEAGGNAFRTWGTEHLDVQLAAAERYGLKVLVGLDMQKQLQGFDYEDSDAVAQQLATLKASIDRYRSHPSLLGWIIANEPNLMIDANGAAVQPNPAVYAAMGDVLEYLHEQDPHHPATVAFAFTATLAEDVRLALKSMPSLDFLSLQAYGALPVIAPLIRELDIDLPYMVTEFGPLGHWEMPATQWGREIEEPSGVKAAGMVERMGKAGLDAPHGKLLGGFAFLWGQKQERTPTWYGLFTADGSRTAAVDELTRLWTGQYPAQRAPSAWLLTLNEQQASASVSLAPGVSVNASLQASDPDGNALSISWEVMSEVQERSHGGHFEAQPEVVEVDFSNSTHVDDRYGVTLLTPKQPGHYRLYAWAHDGQGGVATANFPFLVSAP